MLASAPHRVGQATPQLDSIGPFTLNPKRDTAVAMATLKADRQPLAAYRDDNCLDTSRVERQQQQLRRRCLTGLC